jgi:hypothetical protein
MTRWRMLFPGLLLVALVACGGTTATTSNPPLADPTPTSIPASASAPASSAPRFAPPTFTATPPTPSSATPATRTTAPRAASTATLGATPVPQPNGTVPIGWKVYRGSPVFPFVVAYPPDWTVDDALLPDQRVVYFYGPDGRDDTPERIDIEISQTATGANIDVQRDEFFREESAFCDQKGIEYTEQRQVAGVAFAVLGATCDSSNELSFMQVASGLKHGDEWNILMRTPYDRKEARLRDVFNPILASLNIYAAIPD